MENLIDKFFSVNGLGREIDQLAYALYGLTEEIKIVEGGEV